MFLNVWYSLENHSGFGISAIHSRWKTYFKIENVQITDYWLIKQMSLVMRKLVMSETQRHRSACRSAQSDQHLCCLLSRQYNTYMCSPSLISLHSALNGWMGTQCFFMRTAKTLIRLGEYSGWSESSLYAQAILLVLSCCGSYVKKCVTFSTFSYFIQKHYQYNITLILYN